MARKKHPGLPQDSGRTMEELEAALQAEREKNKKTIVGEYMVKSDLKLLRSFKSRKELKIFLGKGFVKFLAFDEVTNDKGRITRIDVSLTLPAIVRVDAKKQDASIEIDEDTFNHILNGQQQEQKQKEEQSEQSKPKSKTKPESESEQDKRRLRETGEMAAKMLGYKYMP